MQAEMMVRGGRRLAVLTAMLILNRASFGQEPSTATPLQIGSLPVSRILFLGNSITLHAPAPEIGWTGNWGMAASSEDRDYVHLLVRRIEKEAGRRPEIRVRNIADFERAPGQFRIDEQLREELAFRPNVVIIAIGENAARPDSTEAKQKFSEAFRRLLETVEGAGHPRIFVRSQFWADPVKDSLMQVVTQDRKHGWIDLSQLVDESCYARSEREIRHAGVAGHPGDKGMQVIADAILKSIQQASQASRQ